MTGYNLWLKGAIDEDGYEEDPYFLRLCYDNYTAAFTAKEILEALYGIDEVFIDVKAPEISLTE